MSEHMTTFLGLPFTSLDDLQGGDMVILSATEATPYEPNKPSHAGAGAAAVRATSQRQAEWRHHFDFETNGPLINSQLGRVLDAGDVASDPTAPAANRAAIEAAVRRVLDAGAVPFVLGGDDAVPIPAIAAYRDHGPIWIVQIDAHLDWRDERDGEPLGWSSTMRRASEMGWVQGIVQIGARGVGSARPEDLTAARNYGAHIGTAREVHTHGVSQAINHIPAGAQIFIALDCDGLDPSVMPAVMAQVPGGLTYWQVIEIIEQVKARGRLAGMDIVELVPERDINEFSAKTVGRILAVAIHAAQEGWHGPTQ